MVRLRIQNQAIVITKSPSRTTENMSGPIATANENASRHPTTRITNADLRRSSSYSPRVSIAAIPRAAIAIPTMSHLVHNS